MLANPLGDVGLGSHHALIERTLPGELKIFFLAIGGIGDGADSQDDFNHSNVLDSKHGIAILRLIHRQRFKFRHESRRELGYRRGDDATSGVPHPDRPLPHRNL
jgi:hypothetical protein